MNVFLTGGSGGIGLAIKNKFESLNHQVYAPTRKDLDLSNLDSIDSITNHIKTDIDILINNAGINDIYDLEDINLSSINSILQINTIAPLLLIKSFSQNMIKNKKGHIINISSILSYRSKKGRILYSASKAALNSITKSCALELAEHNIQVNAICPGYVETNLTYKNNTPSQITKIKEMIPIKRLLKPEEIADAVYNLSLNNIITGQIISIDGGLSTCI
jgi:NAD(P)-dependent dehydrogenase (short-subunit alcohol dehydrogenase family)